MPLIKSFKIIGLHGYKNVSIDFESDVKILISENGSGKTTIFNAMYFFLTRDFPGLRTIDFDEIVCCLDGDNRELRLSKKDFKYSNRFFDSEIIKLFAEYNIDETDLNRFISTEYVSDDMSSIQNSDVGNRLYAASPWDWDEIAQRLEIIKNEIEESLSDKVKDISLRIKEAVGDTEILYLPTYRRVETVVGARRNPKRRRSRNHALFGFSLADAAAPAGGLKASHGRQINYGLGDVEEKLTSLTDEIQRRTNIGYRSISATIIEDLLKNTSRFEGISSSELPDKKLMQRFFSRIGSVSDGIELDDDLIDEIYDEGAGSKTNRNMLRYFMSKLSNVVNDTTIIETKIEEFVRKSNDYLGMSVGDKKLRYDSEKMAVYVENGWTGKTIKLNDLSSGEKQVLSLLAYLYLYDSKKLILIDEPELSLSIEWQRRILVDVSSSDNCKQLLAITHSPFIYDNELDPCADSLNIDKIKIDED